MPVTVTCSIDALCRNILKPSNAVHHHFCKYTHVVSSMYIHYKNTGRTCAITGCAIHQGDFGMGHGLPYTSFMATCVFENMWLFGCMHFLCGWGETEKLQLEHLKVSNTRWRVRAREDNTGGQEWGNTTFWQELAFIVGIGLKPLMMHWGGQK